MSGVLRRLILTFVFEFAGQPDQFSFSRRVFHSAPIQLGDVNQLFLRVREVTAFAIAGGWEHHG